MYYCFYHKQSSEVNITIGLYPSNIPAKHPIIIVTYQSTYYNNTVHARSDFTIVFITSGSSEQIQ